MYIIIFKKINKRICIHVYNYIYMYIYFFIYAHTIVTEVSICFIIY